MNLIVKAILGGKHRHLSRFSDYSQRAVIISGGMLANVASRSSDLLVNKYEVPASTIIIVSRINEEA